MFDYKTAAAYIRVSTDDQVELSPASQLVEIRKWASANGYFVPDEYVFVDEAKSGRKVTGRDDFRRLIATAKTKPKPFDAILLWKFSRFARNRDDAVYYKSILRKQLKIDVISIKEPIEDGKMGVIMESMIEAMDEYYSINLAEDVKRGMEEKHRRGELQSTPAFGSLFPSRTRPSMCGKCSAASMPGRALTTSPAGSTICASKLTAAAPLKTAPWSISSAIPCISASCGGTPPGAAAGTLMILISSSLTANTSHW